MKFSSSNPVIIQTDRDVNHKSILNILNLSYSSLKTHKNQILNSELVKKLNSDDIKVAVEITINLLNVLTKKEIVKTEMLIFYQDLHIIYLLIPESRVEILKLIKSGRKLLSSEEHISSFSSINLNNSETKYFENLIYEVYYKKPTKNNQIYEMDIDWVINTSTIIFCDILNIHSGSANDVDLYELHKVMVYVPSLHTHFGDLILKYKTS
ncbi:MAG: hypothetical protein EAZ27_02545 [Cytophagales bacterium]|nr:MAG: hypothetical protein EAZ27_02545 [Cytophagales bacterium]